MNVVNFIDGVDGLAAGVCTITGITFALIAFSQHRIEPHAAGVLALITAGASLGYLRHGFHPASIFLGDSGSNLLGYLRGAIVVQGTLKTNALVGLAFPLVILAVPILDSSFVIAKRIKYRRPVYQADRWHFHHRFANIGFSPRKTTLYLYGWTVTMAGLALAIRFFPYSDHHRHFHTGWVLALIGCGLVGVAAPVSRGLASGGGGGGEASSRHGGRIALHTGDFTWKVAVNGPAATVAAENRRPGTEDCRLPGGVGRGEVEGYVASQSVRPGQVQRVYVHSKGARWIRVDVYRMGW